jgi:hypothetical protein
MLGFVDLCVSCARDIELDAARYSSIRIVCCASDCEDSGSGNWSLFNHFARLVIYHAFVIRAD